jgi:hypothetical protein
LAFCLTGRSRYPGKETCILWPRLFQAVESLLTGSSRKSYQYNNFRPKVDSNPIAPRVRRNASGFLLLCSSKAPRIGFQFVVKVFPPEAFPIKPSDNPSAIRELGIRRKLRQLDIQRVNFIGAQISDEKWRSIGHKPAPWEPLGVDIATCLLS